LKIQGIEGMSIDQVRFEVQRGGKFVVYNYCVSVLIMTFKRASPLYFIPAGQSAVGKSLPWTLLTLVAGWWGIPWGPIFSVQSLVVNFKGGKDVTAEIAARLQPAQSQAPVAAGSQWIQT
jgi:hypothetical protein